VYLQKQVWARGVRPAADHVVQFAAGGDAGVAFTKHEAGVIVAYSVMGEQVDLLVPWSNIAGIRIAPTAVKPGSAGTPKSELKKKPDEP
jgi:hypothetical protein